MKWINLLLCNSLTFRQGSLYLKRLFILAILKNLHQSDYRRDGCCKSNRISVVIEWSTESQLTEFLRASLYWKCLLIFSCQFELNWIDQSVVIGLIIKLWIKLISCTQSRIPNGQQRSIEQSRKGFDSLSAAAINQHLPPSYFVRHSFVWKRQK